MYTEHSRLDVNISNWTAVHMTVPKFWTKLQEEEKNILYTNSCQIFTHFLNRGIMTSHFLVPFNTWFLTGPTSRQCALYLGNKDPIREGREVRAGLDLRVQISHQAGTDHQIGLFFWGGLFLTDCWSHSHDSVFLRGVAEVSERLCGLWRSQGRDVGLLC